MEFQSTLPRRERHDNDTFIQKIEDFNPRSHEGSDITVFNLKPAFKTFQSTLPRRERLTVFNLKPAFKTFQSTLPRRERRFSQTSTDRWKKDFNPRSHEGSDVCIYSIFTNNSISIHAPTKGATFFQKRKRTLTTISIHAPTKGATIVRLIVVCMSLISIHAPTKGATAIAQIKA